MLINNAAVYLKCSALQDIKVDEMMQSYRTNVVGPAIMFRLSLSLVFCVTSNGHHLGIQEYESKIKSLETQFRLLKVKRMQR